MKLRILSGDDVRRALPMEQAIAAMGDAFTQISSGAARVPTRMNMNMKSKKGEMLLMPVHLPGLKSTGTKIVNVYHENPSRNLPLIHGLVLVFDDQTGEPRALLDGEVLTALRTGAASGLATGFLAAENAETAALFGAGIQAGYQLEALRQVRPIRRVLVFDPGVAKARAFARDWKQRAGLQVEINPKPEALLKAEIVCTATTSRDPVFEPRFLGPGTHINAIGAYRPDLCEIPPETVSRARVVVDQRSACWAEAGDLIQPLEAGIICKNHVLAELGELVAGKKVRQNVKQVTLFKSVGNAAQDLAAAARVLDAAVTMGLGTECSI